MQGKGTGTVSQMKFSVLKGNAYQAKDLIKNCPVRHPKSRRDILRNGGQVKSVKDVILHTRSWSES